LIIFIGGLNKLKIMKILNLYACLGGNRYKWDEVAKEKGIEIEVTAVEYDVEIAKLYQERFPNDKVIVSDAHQYLLDHYKEFDFIWSSPPCPSHSRMNISQYTRESWKPKFPDFKLYEEVVFLDSYFKGKYVVENVIPYYEPLIAAKKRHRHLYWTNFNLPNVLSERTSPDWSRIKNEAEAWNEFHDYDFKKYKGKAYREIGRNLVDYEAGRTIFETVLGIEKNHTNQTKLF
jgi:DNA (cytosine-5)-methyltransferase 1